MDTECRKITKALLLGCIFADTVFAEVVESEPPKLGEFSIMQALSERHLHDIENERWNAYGQATYISSWKAGFKAAYTNLNGTPNSLSTKPERSFTGSFTAYFGLKPWQGGEIYAVPEVISLLPLSNLHGLGGAIQNFELQKSGSQMPTPYLSRLFFRQTWDLSGDLIHIDSGQMQLGKTVAGNRFAFTIGNLSVIDIFDKNAYSGDLRQQFFNMSFLSYASYDFAADARGYSWGLAGELYYGDWTFRYGRFIAPAHPNQLALDFRIWKYYGDQIEVEHRHTLNGQSGAVRILAYRNHENMGRWRDAVAALRADPTKTATNCVEFNYDSDNSTAPDLCWVRKPNNKMGVGLNLEQQLTQNIGIFFRGMYSDGDSEVYSYLSSDRSISFGTLIKGTAWNRPRDTLGIGYAQSWISKAHAEYLNLGGIDGFIGDGKLNRQPERLVEVFYNINLLKSVWFTLDYQHISNPAYNGDRGPVDIFGVRGHIEF